jgi:hypothetical protein
MDKDKQVKISLISWQKLTEMTPNTFSYKGVLDKLIEYYHRQAQEYRNIYDFFSHIESYLVNDCNQDKQPITNEQDKQPITNEQDKQPITNEQDKQPITNEQDKQPITNETTDKQTIVDSILNKRLADIDITDIDKEQLFNISIAELKKFDDRLSKESKTRRRKALVTFLKKQATSYKPIETLETIE